MLLIIRKHVLMEFKNKGLMCLFNENRLPQHIPKDIKAYNILRITNTYIPTKYVVFLFLFSLITTSVRNITNFNIIIFAVWLPRSHIMYYIILCTIVHIIIN